MALAHRTAPISLLVALLLACCGVKASEVVRLASLEWEPYIGENMPEQGYVAALVRAAYAERGVPVQITFYPWARALHLARIGELDGLMPEYFDQTREAEFRFSQPFTGGPLGLYKRRDAAIQFAVNPQRDAQRAFSALRGQRFGVVRGYLNTPEFDAADYLVKEAAISDEINLRKLVFERVDLVVIDVLVAEHLLRTRLQRYRTRLELMPPPLQEKSLYIAFSKKSRRAEAALAQFNEGLLALKANGQLEALRTRLLNLGQSEQRTAQPPN